MRKYLSSHLHNARFNNSSSFIIIIFITSKQLCLGIRILNINLKTIIVLIIYSNMVDSGKLALPK